MIPSFETIREELYAAVVGDIMDKMGLLHQFLPPVIRPLHPDMMVAGKAMTVLEADLVEEGEKPFGLMLEALDDLKKDEVYLCAGASPSYALWGELMGTRARTLGATGAVVDGYSRDTKGLLALGFPTFSHGPYAQDQAPRGQVVDFRVPLSMRGVMVSPGDYVIGDVDGVCIVPAAAAEEVFQRALEKARGERTVQKRLMEGMSAAEAFATYGIL